MTKLRLAVVALAVLGWMAACGGDSDDGGDGGGTGNPAGVGNDCSIDADCPTNDCFLRDGIGYCTDECQNEGDTSACPVDTVCKPIQGAERRCLLVCGSSSSCRGLEGCAGDYCPRGSSCVAVSGTDLRACEPDP